MSTFSLGRRSRYRLFVDRLSRVCITSIGLFVSCLVLTMVVYFLIEALPLFRPASLGHTTQVQTAPNFTPLFRLAGPEGQIFVEGRPGGLTTRDLNTGRPLGLIPFKKLAQWALVQSGANPSESLIWEGNDKESRLLSLSFGAHYTDKQLQSTLNFNPNAPLLSVKFKTPPRLKALRETNAWLLLLSLSRRNTLEPFFFRKDQNAFSGERTFTKAPFALPLAVNYAKTQHILINRAGTFLIFVQEGGFLEAFSLKDPNAPLYLGRYPIDLKSERPLKHARLLELNGGNTFLIVDDELNLYKITLLPSQTQALRISPPQHLPRGTLASLQAVPRGRDYLIAYENGRLLYQNATTQSVVLDQTLSLKPGALLEDARLSPKNNRVLAFDNKGTLYQARFKNPAESVSLKSLFFPVQYEEYDEPKYIWQSTGSEDYEPKLSLIPLIFGTLKAAAYTMILALPLGVLAAVYTACFMRPRLRKLIKPTVELIAALPTVILGFLGALILSPWLEKNLFAFLFAVIWFIPLIFIVSLALEWLFQKLRWHSSENTPLYWLFGVLIVAPYPLLQGGKGLEFLFFNGDFLTYLRTHFELLYSQRNAIVISILLGFAVMPIIFSITEDAIFSIPRSLTTSSLALGASPWQTVFHIILPAASPAILSAAMIGLGRAVGETMIVLMASGNTPILSASPFEGLRSLASNIAVEMPESVLGSAHYRILFFSGLTLFAFTFIMNLLSEWVRGLLIRRYRRL